MNFKKTPKIIGISFISIVSLMVLLNLVINSFINNLLPKIIDEKNNTDLLISYGKINFSIFNNSITIQDIKIKPKIEQKDLDKFQLLGNIHSIGISGVNFFELIKNKNIHASTILINNPNITYFKSSVLDTLKTKSNFINSINIDKISIRQGNLEVKNHIGDTLLNQVFNLNAQIDVLHMGKYTENKDIPFTYSNYTFQVDSVFTKLNGPQYVKVDEIQIDPSNLSMLNFRILSTQEITKDKTNKPHIEVVVPKLNLKGTDWALKNSNLEVKISQIQIDSVDFQILNKKKTNSITDSPLKETKNHSIIPFDLEVETLDIKKSSFSSMHIFDVNNVNIQIKGISNKKNKQLRIKEFYLNKPNIVQVSKNTNKKQSKQNTFNLNNEIIIDEFKINEATYILKDKSSKKNELSVQNLNLSLHAVFVDEKTLKKKIPFTYQNSHLITGKVHFDSGEFYNIYTNGITLKNDQITISNFEMKPKYTRKVFNSKLKYGTDIYTISAEKIELKKIQWGFDSKQIFYLKLDELDLNKVHANIYRDAKIANEPKVNKLYSEKLRDLKFGLDISKINLKNTTLEYEEEDEQSLAPGKLSFSHFNATIQNIYSGYGRKTGKKTKIVANTTFMKNSKVHADWTFDIMNKSDLFNINGTVKDLPAEAMNPFIKPYLNISAAGNIDEVVFDFTGNNKTSKGTFGMNYAHLKVTLYKKDGEKKRKLLSAIGNLAIKKNTRGKTITTETKSVNRDLDCSFFNFFWLNLRQGIKQTLL